MFRVGRNQAGHEPIQDQTPQHSSLYNAESNFQKPAAAPLTSRAVTESEALARDIKEGTLNGFVGVGTAFTGEATFRGMLRIDGRFSGSIGSEDGTLIVSAGGKVDANIKVAVAVINGTINGDIVASQRLEMGRAARVTGNIQTPALVVEQGAVFEGNCTMVKLKEAQESKQREKESRVSVSQAFQTFRQTADTTEVTEELAGVAS